MPSSVSVDARGAAGRAGSSCPGRRCRGRRADPSLRELLAHARRAAASSDGTRRALRRQHARAGSAGTRSAAVELASRSVVAQRVLVDVDDLAVAQRAAEGRLRKCGGGVAGASGVVGEHARVHLHARRDAEHGHARRRRRRGCRARCRRRPRRAGGRPRGRRLARAASRVSSAVVGRACAGDAGSTSSSKPRARGEVRAHRPRRGDHLQAGALALEPRERPIARARRRRDARRAPRARRWTSGAVRALQPDTAAEPGERVDDQPERGDASHGQASRRSSSATSSVAARATATIVSISSSVITNGGENAIVSAAGSARVITPRSRQRARDARADAERRVERRARDPRDSTNSTAADQPEAAHLADERVVGERLAQQARA